MSVVEKTAPRRKILGLALAVVTVAVLAIVLAFSVDGGSSSSAPASTTRRGSSASSTVKPASTLSAVTSASVFAAPSRVEPIDVGFDRDASYRLYLQRTEAATSVRVFAFIDLDRGELHFVPDDPPKYGAVVGRFADRLVLGGSQLRVIDRDLATAPLPIGGDEFVGSWRDHAIIAEYFPERTTFHEYDRDGREVRSVGLVGRHPDVTGGIARDSVVIERGGRIIVVGLADATVREFAVGHLLGVGGGHVFFTACTEEGECTLNNALVGDVLRSTPIDNYVDPTSGRVPGRVAPDGSGIVAHDYSRASDVVIRLGTRVGVAAGEEFGTYTWSPTGRWIFRVDESTKALDAIDSFDGTVVRVPLPPADTVSLRSAAAW